MIQYDLTGKTWAALTRSAPPSGNSAEIGLYQAGDARYHHAAVSGMRRRDTEHQARRREYSVIRA